MAVKVHTVDGEGHTYSDAISWRWNDDETLLIISEEGTVAEYRAAVVKRVFEE